MAVKFLDGIDVAGPSTFSDTLTVTAIGGIDIDTAGHASLTLDRASTSYDNNIIFRTNGDTKFRLWQDGNADYLYIRDDDNATNMVTFKKGGNVGIGTTNPAYKLSVENSLLVFSSGDTADPKTEGHLLRVTNTANDNPDVEHRFVENHGLGYGFSWFMDGNNNNFSLRRHDNSVNGTTVFRVNRSNDTAYFAGDVGIGTTTPNSGGSSAKWLTLAGSSYSGGIIFVAAGTIKGYNYYDGNFINYQAQSGYGHQFKTNTNTSALTIASSGNVGIGTTSPTSKLHVNGLIQGEGINSLYIGTLTAGSSTGWYRAMEWTGSSRGGSVICLSLTGGSWGPVTYVIKAYKTFGNPAGSNTLKLEQYGSNAYITEARITWDEEESKAFVEVYKNVTGSMPLSMFQDKLIGYDATSTVLTGTASAGGGSVLEQLKFVPEGTTMEKLLISDSIAVGGITNSTTAGRIDAANDVVAYSTSDIRLKNNIKTIDSALDKVNKIQGIEFDWIEKEEVHGNSGHDVGVVAQEIEKILPDVVTTRDNGYKAVKYEKIVPLLIEAIKDLSKQVDGLKRLI